MDRPPVEVADWFEPWWGFWAGISNALVWPAWSAVLSFLALGATIYLANTNARRTRRSDATFVEGVANVLDTAFQGARLYIASAGAGQGTDVQRARLARFYENTKAAEVIHGINLTDFPSPESLRLFLSAKPIALLCIQAATGETGDFGDDDMRGWIAAGDTFIAEFLEEIERLR